MKIKTTLILAIFSSFSVFSQPPRLYIQIVSHNEPNENLQNALNYQKAKANLMMMANIVNDNGVKWNLQTSDGLVFGARTDQQTTGSNIFSLLSSGPYGDNIEIDPRSKNLPGRNIADQWYLIDSLGGNPSTTVGGFIYEVCPPGDDSLIDWWQYQDTITGMFYGNKVKFDLLSGAGSLPPHCNDLRDFGIFKPDTVSNFYSHNPSRNTWCVGTGCAPLLDSMSNEQAIIDLIQGQVDSIQNGLWPEDKFYVTRIMTNQREYGPLFFSKISKVLDSLALIPDTQLQWATIGETFQYFQDWTMTSGIAYSQWSCGQATTETHEIPKGGFRFFPNPFTGQATLHTGFPLRQANLSIANVYGQIVKQITGINEQTIILDRGNLPEGLYFLCLTQEGKIIATDKVLVANR